MQLLDRLLAPNADESLGQYLRRLRLQRGLSQQKVVGLAGIHLQSLGKIERGRTLKLNHKTCSGLAYALNVPKECLEAVAKGVAMDVPSALKFCPSCWTVGMAPESMWLDLRAKYCFLCGMELRHRCVGCHEPITSVKHRFCPFCGTSYQTPSSSKV
jgi:transcriptional regulator with XRE-family HTH domain